MKSSNPLLLFFLCKVLSAQAFAAETPHSYNQFCETTAPQMITKLNDATKEETAKIAKLRQNIDELKAKSILVKGVSDIKKGYLSGLARLQKEDSSKLQDVAQNINSIRSTMQNALAISAITMLMKDQDLNHPDAFSIKHLCQNAENAKTKLCAIETAKKSSFLKNPFSRNKTLDDALKSFKKAYVRVEDKADLKKDINSILNEIPKNLDPEVVMDMIQSKSPQVTELVTADFAREDLMKCLDNSQKLSEVQVMNACKVLLNDPNSKNKLQELISFESSALKADVKGKLSPALDALSAKTQNDLSEGLKKFENLSLNSSKEIVGKSYADIKTLTDNISKNTGKNGFAALLGKSEEEGKAFEKQMQEQCAASTDKNSECAKTVNLVLESASFIDQNIIAEINKDQAELAKIRANADFMKLEKLKKYVGDKYLRTCQQHNKEVSVVSTKVDQIDAQGCNVSQGGFTLTSIKGLSADVSDVMSATMFTETLDGRYDGKFAFSKAEVDAYKSLCIGKLDREYPEICDSIHYDSRAQLKVKKEMDWDKLHKENWVEYDFDTGGYKTTKKKHTGLIIAEGVLPVIPSLIPMYFANEQMKYQIDYLTDAALYQKQQMHYYDIYNTQWINGYGNPFSTDYLNNGNLVTGGYNFGGSMI
jgi:hypothetical protein